MMIISYRLHITSIYQLCMILLLGMLLPVQGLAGHEEYIKFMLKADKQGTVRLSANDLKGTIDARKMEIGALHPGVWRWEQGDKPEYAWNTFNDEDWMLIRMNTIDSLRPDWNRVFWLRSRILIDSALRYTSIAMMPGGVGAAEYYLNGRLVAVVGHPSNHSSDEVPIFARGKPFIIQFGAELENILAVRYSFHSMPLGYTLVPSIKNNPFFWIRFAPVEEALAVQRTKESYFSVRYLIAIGMMLSLSLLHIALFAFYRKQRFHIFYATFTLLVAVRFLTVYMENIVEPHPGVALFFDNISNVYNNAIPFVCWIFFYSLFYDKLPRRRLYAASILTFGVVIALVLGATQGLGKSHYGYIYDVSMVVIVLFTADAVRITLQALRRGEPGAGLLLFGIADFGLMWTLRWLTMFKLFPFTISPNALETFVYAGYMAVPLAMSLYIALVVSKTQKSLQEQIIQVQELSERALEQERQAKEAAISRTLLQADNERKTRELEEARVLQLSMLPNKLPEHPRFEVAAFMRTATEVGGDYYDFRLSEDGKTLIAAVGDATGHGMKAGYLVSTTKSYFQTLARESSGTELLTHISHGIKNMNLRGMYMCLALVRCEETEQGTIRVHIAIAGMPPVMIYRAKSRRVEEICLKALPLGSITNFTYQEVVTTLDTDDVMLIMSDGLPELFNEHQETLDMGRVTACFQEAAEKSPHEVMNALKRCAEDWTQGTSPLDDMTMVVMKVTPERQPAMLLSKMPPEYHMNGRSSVLMNLPEVAEM